MELLFVADPLEVFKTYKDTTFAMMREAARRGHTLLACGPGDMAWQRDDRVHAKVREIALTGDPHAWFSVNQNAAPGFKNAPAVLNGASDLLIQIFGPELGPHARMALYQPDLPRDAPIAGEIMYALRD